MTGPRTWYIVMAVQSWDALQVSVGMGGAQSPGYAMQPSDDPDQPTGFLPVFDIREAAEKHADGKPVAKMQAIEDEPSGGEV